MDKKKDDQATERESDDDVLDKCMRIGCTKKDTEIIIADMEGALKALFVMADTIAGAKEVLVEFATKQKADGKRYPHP